MLKEKIDKGLKYLFLFLSVGLTFISLSAGFHIYLSLFDLFTAILVSSIFEILRLSCLYTISRFSSWRRYMSISLYVMTAGICFFAALFSFNAKAIDKDRLRLVHIEDQMNKDFYLIKSAYSQRIDVDLKELQKHKDLMQQQALRNPKSLYYPARIEQDEQKIEELNVKRDDFFDKAEANRNPRWIQDQKAIFGLIKVSDTYDSQLSSFEEAATGIFNVSVLTLKKMVGFALTITVELGIILLAILGTSIKTENPENIQTPKRTYKRKPKALFEVEDSPITWHIKPEPTVEPEQKTEETPTSAYLQNLQQDISKPLLIEKTIVDNPQPNEKIPKKKDEDISPEVFTRKWKSDNMFSNKTNNDLDEIILTPENFRGRKSQ